jgi:hypothetical protein
MELILLSGLGSAVLLVVGLYELVREHRLRERRATVQRSPLIAQAPTRVTDTVTTLVLK